MEGYEMELPSRTEVVDVWGEGGNGGEDSGVDAPRATSCASSVLSAFSEPDTGSDTSHTLKVTYYTPWNVL